MAERYSSHSEAGHWVVRNGVNISVTPAVGDQKLRDLCPMDALSLARLLLLSVKDGMEWGQTGWAPEDHAAVNDALAALTRPPVWRCHECGEPIGKGETYQEWCDGCLGRFEAQAQAEDQAARDAALGARERGY